MDAKSMMYVNAKGRSFLTQLESPETTLLLRQAVKLADGCGQISSGTVLQEQVHMAGPFVEPVHAHDIGVVQFCTDFDLLL